MKERINRWIRKKIKPHHMDPYVEVLVHDIVRGKNKRYPANNRPYIIEGMGYKVIVRFYNGQKEGQIEEQCYVVVRKGFSASVSKQGFRMSNDSTWNYLISKK